MFSVNSKDASKVKITDYMPLLTDNWKKEVSQPISQEKINELLERDKKIKEALNK